MPPQGEHSHHSVVSNAVRHGYVISNGAASLVELGAGILSGNVALAADGLHGSAEIVIGNEQMKDAQSQEAVVTPRRKKIFHGLFWTSMTGSGIALGEVFNLWNPGIHDARIDAIGMMASGLAFVSASAASGKILSKVRQKYGAVLRSGRLNPYLSPADRDVVNHVARLDLPSSAMAFTATSSGLVANTVATRYGIDPTILETIQEGTGVLLGAWGAWLFRPTQANLTHTHQHEMPAKIDERTS